MIFHKKKCVHQKLNFSPKNEFHQKLIFCSQTPAARKAVLGRCGPRGVTSSLMAAASRAATVPATPAA